MRPGLHARMATSDEREAAAENLVAEAAGSVLAAEADAIAGQLMTANRVAWGHAARLRGLAAIWLATNGGPLRPIPISAKARAALDEIDPREANFVPGTGPEARAQAAFRAWHVQLLQDADATLNDE
jgi:hypothetical protein